MNILKKRIGIIGGGQLGKMMILDAKRLGFHVATLDPSPACPSHSISDELVVASFDDTEAIRSLAERCDVITYEFEHIHVDILLELEKEGHAVYPTAASLAVIQNKYDQKKALQEAGIAVPDFLAADSVSAIMEAGKRFGYPMMLKACTGGYDGKGNAVIEDEEAISWAFETLGAGKVPLMVEAFVPFEKEISVLACRGIDGEIAVYPVGENIHVDSILDTTMVPAAISEACTAKAMAMAHDVMDVFHGVGMFCVEMFVTGNESVYLNEVAPRPHNSGHYTIEGCLASQFEQHIRAITGLPLGDVSLRCPTVMVNLLGEPGSSGPVRVVGVEEAMKAANVKVHIYGKEVSKPYRKMGHLTVAAASPEEALETAKQAKQRIKIQGGSQ